MEDSKDFQPKNIWQLIYFFYTRSNQKAIAWTFLLVVLGFTIFMVGMSVIFNYWYNDFYNSLQQYDKRGILDLVWVFLLLAAIYMAVAVYQFFLQQLLEIRWRRWLTYKILGRWLDRRVYYYMENFDIHTDNPDQRICEDIRDLVLYTLSLGMGLLTAIGTLIAFLGILWKLSGDLVIPMKGLGDISLGFTVLHFSQMHAIHIKGYLVYIAFFYAFFGTYIAFRIGYPLIGLRFHQQRLEADFRFNTINIRTHSEHIALYRGETVESKNIKHRVELVLKNWFQIVLREKKLLWFSSGYNQLAVILPLMAALPNYLKKVFQLGGLIQTLNAFGKIHESLSYLLNAYTTIALWRAILRRLSTLLGNIDDADGISAQQKHFHYREGEEDAIILNHVTIKKPDGTVIKQDIHHRFSPGRNILIKGRSGLGKTTLIRVIAGIWPFGQGEVIIPKHKKVMYIPQKPYMPLDTLRHALSFPHETPFDNDVLHKVLVDCHLEHLMEKLDVSENWGTALSPGEQQRVAFARIILQQPDWLFLDESTASVDTQIEKDLYTLLHEKLPHCTFISIGHRETIHDFHAEVLEFSEL